MNRLAKMITLMFLLAVTFTWDMPTTNTDGSPLTDLAGARIYCGTETGVYSLFADPGNVTTYTTTAFPKEIPQYCVMTAYNTSGNESVWSVERNFTYRLRPGAPINLRVIF